MRVNYGLSGEPSGEYIDGDPATPLLASLPTGQTYVRYEYDAEGRKIKDIAPNDSGGETVTFYVYDDEGRQTKVVHNYKEATYPSGHGAANDENIIYETVYNQYGQRTELIDAEGHSTWFEYDDFGRLKRKFLDKDGSGIREKGGDDYYEEYTYDKGRGLLTKKRNFDGSTVTYQYDAETDKRTFAYYPDGVTYAYDYDSQQRLETVVETHPEGRRTTSFFYDPVTGRVSQVSKQEGTLNYEYNAEGHLARLWESTRADGIDYQYYYDEVGRLKTVETPSGSAQYQYYVNGSRKSLTLPNQVTTTYIYDDLLRLDKVEHRDAGLNLLAEFDYTVGRTGKRSGVAEEIDGVTSAWQYEYDGLGRICDATRETSGSAAVVYHYQYDLVGNRTEKSVGASTTTYEYNALDQLETETAPGGTITYDYDANGNLKYKSSAGQETNYVYDARNKLKQVYQGAILDGNLAVEFAYDFSGNRYAKSTRVGSDFEHKRFLIDNNNLSGYSQTFLEYEYYTGAVEKRYEYGDDLYCEATPLPSSPVNGGGDVTNLFFLYDGLGSTRSLTNSDGEIAQSYNYHPFGEGIDQPQNPSTNHLFTGEYFDQDLSYFYLRARYYVPSIGRFTSHDPVEDQANKLHKYAYCDNDSINSVDPSGEFITFQPIMVNNFLKQNIHSIKMGRRAIVLSSSYSIVYGGIGNIPWRGAVAALGIVAVVGGVSYYTIETDAQIRKVRETIKKDLQVLDQIVMPGIVGPNDIKKDKLVWWRNYTFDWQYSPRASKLKDEIHKKYEAIKQVDDDRKAGLISRKDQDKAWLELVQFMQGVCLYDPYIDINWLMQWDCFDNGLEMLIAGCWYEEYDSIYKEDVTPWYDDTDNTTYHRKYFQEMRYYRMKNFPDGSGFLYEPVAGETVRGR